MIDDNLQPIVADEETGDLVDAGDGLAVAGASPPTSLLSPPATLIDSTTGEKLDAGGGSVILAEGGTHQFLGIIDDVRLYTSVPDDATALGRARRELDTGEAAETLLYLKFSEGTGSTAFDSSPGTHDATLHGGTDWVGFEGTSDLAGTRKRMVWGVRRMRKGVVVDNQRCVVQLNNGPTHAIVPSENGYASLTYDGDFDDIYDWTSTAGHYATQLSIGLVRLHEFADGVTYAYDVWGNVDPERGYTDVGAEIMRNIATRHGGFDDVDQVDTAAVAYVAEQRPDAVGIDTGDSPVTGLDLLNQLASGMDGWWTTLPRDSRFTVGLREEPGIPEFVLGVNDICEDGLERIASSLAVRQWTLTYADFEVTVDPDSVAGAIPIDQRSRYSKSNLSAQSLDLILVDPAFARRFPKATTMTGATLYDDAAACRRECERRLLIDRWPRDVYSVTLPTGVFQYRVGQSGWVVYPRWSLDQGNGYAVGGYEAATDTGTVSLSIWGRKLDGTF